jgi:hypothetical protein
MQLKIVLRLELYVHVFLTPKITLIFIVWSLKLLSVLLIERNSLYYIMQFVLYFFLFARLSYLDFFVVVM